MIMRGIRNQWVKLVRLLRDLLDLRNIGYARAGGLIGFAICFLPHLLTDPCAAFHDELGAALDGAAAPGGRLIGALPREHAKTTLGTVALTLRELCLGDKRNILLVAANREEAQVKLRQIVGEIETNPNLPADWGRRLEAARDAKGQRVAYGDSEIVLSGGARVSVVGFGGKVRGQLSGGGRLDLVILDDPENDESVASPEQRRKLRHWVDCALLNSLDAHRGSLVWLGTLLHHDSVLAQWIKLHEAESSDWRVLRRAALSDAGEPLWPERWTLKRLAARRYEIGERAFAQEYMNRPVSLAGQLIRPGDLGSYDPAALHYADGVWLLGREPLTVAIGVDPAIGRGTEHDYFAACTVGVAAADDAEVRPRVYVLDVLRLRDRFARQLKLLGELTRRWRPRLIGIEAVAYQAALSQAAWEQGLPVLSMKEPRAKAVRIEAAAVHAAEGRVFLPIAGDWVAAFRQEAADYPAGRHDDQLDAFARALEVALMLSGGCFEVQPAGRRRSEWISGF